MYDIIKMSDFIDTKVESASDDPDYLVTWVTFLVGQVGLICKLNVTRFAKTDIMTHFWKSRFCISELFCHNINAVLQILFELQG